MSVVRRGLWAFSVGCAEDNGVAHFRIESAGVYFGLERVDHDRRGRARLRSVAAVLRAKVKVR